MRRRILFIDEDQQRNGSTVSLEYLASGFTSAGYDVYVLTWKTDQKMRAGLARSATLLDGVHGPITSITLCVHFAYSGSVFSPKAFIRTVKDVVKFIAGLFIVALEIYRVRPDIVYANEYSVVQASLVARCLGVATAIHVRSPMLRGMFGIRSKLISWLVVLCNQRIFAISASEAGQFATFRGGRDNIRVVGEFIPMQKIVVTPHARIREQFGIPSTKRVVTMLGGIKHIKGTIDFLKAATIVAQQDHDVVFVIAGSDHRNGDEDVRSYHEACLLFIEQLRKRDLIRMTGDIMNALELISVSDIIVSPSTQTHFSRPVIEAWSFQKPVVAARSAHMTDLISDGVNGILFDVGDSVGCAAAIDRLLNDEDLCRRIGSEGHRKAQAEFDATQNIASIVETCTSLISA